MVRPDGYYAVADPRRSRSSRPTTGAAARCIPLADAARAARGSPTTPGVALHCDGARIWHAHVADGVPLADVRRGCSTPLSVCLSKGLGAPVGSLVVGSAEQIARARLIRKRMGGGMRQAGILAAAGRYALAHHVDRLADDHAQAARLAEALAPFGVLDPDRVRTNMVPLDLTKAPLDARAAGRRGRAAEGVLVSVLGPRTARLVTHLDVDDAGIDRAVAAVLIPASCAAADRSGRR